MSESAKYSELFVPYLHGNGVDLGCGGSPVVPWAIGFDLPVEKYMAYHGPLKKAGTFQWGGDARDLPFKDATLDFVFSSHLLEDFDDWTPVLREWARVLKPRGFLVVLIPDRQRFQAALAAGHPPNDAHRHEGRVGELTEHITRIGGFDVVTDRLTDQNPQDYSILFVARKA